ncbi:MAG TPA: hypothetical protein VKY92_02765 [Verrucomicrobiae bacterium]|nr:hypothetical protein [Verrucomicrobiae bacterium]
MKPIRIITAVLVAVVLWGGYRAYRAHENLVTLNVHNMEVRRVVSKLRWQTWENIIVSKDVGGRVTLNVHNVPLDEVLNIVGLQTDSRWTKLYPIYLTKKSRAQFNQVLEGAVPAQGNGWAALQQLAAWQQINLGGFANTLRSENKLVSAQLSGKDAPYAALALSRFSKAQVVPEDGINGTATVTFQQVPFDKAVAKLAKQFHRNWDRVYTLQPLNGSTFVKRAVTVPANAAPDDTNQVAAAQPVETIPPDRALEALVSTMSPEERQQTLEQIATATQGAGFGGGGGGSAGGGGAGLNGGGQPQGQPALSPAAQAAQQADLETRIENRLKDGTIDQRLAHDRRVLSGKQK